MVTRGFCDRSNGMFVSCIGALNGWLVKIKKPSVKKDDIQDPVGKCQKTGNHSITRSFFICDSAYAFKCFLITPLDNAVNGIYNNNFNFFLSF
ncbi:hypothetical protein ACHAXS_003883 [Conticribra weissflogii]